MVQFFGDGRCERARALASIELDGELSEVERALLADHVRSCAACAEVRHGMAAVTSLLREAHLERPSVSLRPALSVRARPRSRIALRLGAAAAVTALATGLGVLTATLTTSDERPSAPTERDIALLPPEDGRDVPGLRGRDDGTTQERRPEPARVGGA